MALCDIFAINGLQLKFEEGICDKWKLPKQVKMGNSGLGTKLKWEKAVWKKDMYGLLPHIFYVTFHSHG